MRRLGTKGLDRCVHGMTKVSVRSSTLARRLEYLVLGILVVIMIDTKPFLLYYFISGCMKTIILGTRSLECCIIQLDKFKEIGLLYKFCTKLCIFCALADLLLFIFYCAK